MTRRTNTSRILITVGAVLAAVGCGDPGSTHAVGAENGVAPSLDEELVLACESSCDAVAECPGVHVTIDCVESCVSTYETDRERGAECTTAAIDLLNCFGALSCVASSHDSAGECDDTKRVFRDACGGAGFEVRTPDEPELVAGTEGARLIGADDAGEETPSSDDPEAADHEVTDVTEPVVIADIPHPVVIVNFGSDGESDAEDGGAS
jgi:hypothetical protein